MSEVFDEVKIVERMMEAGAVAEIGKIECIDGIVKDHIIIGLQGYLESVEALMRQSHMGNSVDDIKQHIVTVTAIMKRLEEADECCLGW